MASRCTPAWRAGVRQHGEQVYASMASRCTPAWREALWVEFPASAGAHLPVFPRTCLPSRLYILLSKLAATCSASRLQPALQAGCNLLAKQAETCSPTRLQATGGGQVRFPGNQTGASHSKSWLKSDSPGIGLGGLQQRQRLLSSSRGLLRRRLAPASGHCSAGSAASLSSCHLAASVAGSSLIPGGLDRSQGQEEQHGSFCGWPKQAPVRSPGNRTGASQSRNHIAPAVASSCPIPRGSDWAAPSGHCIAVCNLLAEQVAVCNLLAKQVAVCNLLAKQVAVCNLLAKQVAVCNLLAEQVAVCNLLR
ncbi:hypothetical protein PCANC_28603 [Puccinia coronata f. sp. avenae]|uniref:Uncharacterized protein n=1 Tax=Puccinia coronata f. sp. avenae TaxID=200324 RepID=A0A2N5TBB9_9BASI|nr:hypothetical protein PCANC_28603 [Puccinia coronata f. sp. avenae]